MTTELGGQQNVVWEGDPEFAYQRQKERKQGLPSGKGPVVNNLPSNAGDAGSLPGPGRSHVLWSN